MAKILDPGTNEWVEYTADYQRERDLAQRRLNRAIKNKRHEQNKTRRAEENKERAFAGGKKKK